MDDIALGTACRAVRIRKRLTQAQLAEAARVKRWDVSFLERGMVDRLPLSAMRSMAAILEMRLEIKPRFRGPELDRLVNAAHGALQSAVLRRFDGLSGWVAVPEVTYSIYGERGAIDILAWHPAPRTLLIVELKTVLVDAAEIVRKMDERIRLAPVIAQRNGWQPRVVASWLVFTDTRTTGLTSPGSARSSSGSQGSTDDACGHGSADRVGPSPHSRSGRSRQPRSRDASAARGMGATADLPLRLPEVSIPTVAFDGYLAENPDG